MSKELYDVIIIGAGPAGIFTALELADKGLKVLLLEKGRNIDQRYCVATEKEGHCVHCKPCAIVCGWGGAGAFSDGKLTLTTAFGGILDEYLGHEELQKQIGYIDEVYCKFGAPEAVFGDENKKAIRDLHKKAASADMLFVEARIRHLGTDNCLKILTKMREHLNDKITIKTLEAVESIIVEDGIYKGVCSVQGNEYRSRYLVAAPGREGSEWFSGQAQKLKLTMATNPVDIGVRVELPAVVMENITEIVYESKFIYHTKHFDDRVRTFCMNPFGEVVVENNSGLITVNGHSYADKKTQNTNFALLVSKSFTEPFDEPISYGKSIARLANMLGGGVLVQRVGDLLSGRRSTPERIKRGMVTPTLFDATPGDLSLVLPYRHLLAITEMLEALDKVAPGVNSRHTLLYGVEVKFYSSRLELTNKLETKVKNFFAVGDGAGVTRGLAQASVAGVVVAKEIIARG